MADGEVVVRPVPAKPSQGVADGRKHQILPWNLVVTEQPRLQALGVRIRDGQDEPADVNGVDLADMGDVEYTVKRRIDELRTSLLEGLVPCRQ